MPSLREEQRRLQRAILGHRAAVGAQHFAPARIAIYRHAYRARLAAALGANYPKLALLLGEAAFRRLSLRYAAAHPPHHFSIRWHGAALPAFLPRGATADLARMEWALGESFDAADAEPLRAADLRDLTPGEWARFPLRLHPSVRVVTLEWAVEAAWRTLREGGVVDAKGIGPHDHALLAWRKDLDPHWRCATRAEANALLSLHGAGSLEAACEARDEAGAQELGTWFAGWMADGMLAAARGMP